MDCLLDKDRFGHEKKSSDWFLCLICNCNAREQFKTNWNNNFNQFLLASYWSVFWDISTTWRILQIVCQRKLAIQLHPLLVVYILARSQSMVIKALIKPLLFVLT